MNAEEIRIHVDRQVAASSAKPPARFDVAGLVADGRQLALYLEKRSKPTGRGSRRVPGLRDAGLAIALGEEMRWIAAEVERLRAELRSARPAVPKARVTALIDELRHVLAWLACDDEALRERYASVWALVSKDQKLPGRLVALDHLRLLTAEHEARLGDGRAHTAPLHLTGPAASIDHPSRGDDDARVPPDHRGARMRLLIERLGRIEKAELDVRPLTVFVGPNGTNKTWAAYALFGLARRASLGAWLDRVPPLELEGPLSAIVRDRAASVERALATDDAGSSASDWSFSTDELGPLPDSYAIEVDADELRRVIGTSSGVLRSDALVRLVVDARDVRARPDAVGSSLHLTLRGGVLRVSFGRTSVWMDLRTARGFFVEGLLRRFVGAPFGGVFALPAERKGLMLLAPLLQAGSFAALRSGDAARAKELQDLSGELPLPVRSFMDFAQKISTSPQLSEVHVGPLASTSAALTAELLGGELTFRRPEAGPEQWSSLPALQTLSGPAIDFPAVSSLVRSLAGLDVYLRQNAAPGDFVLIDEPEMNAHPEAQVRIAELLAVLVNRGLRVVVTTHSPYIVDHLQTLIEAARLPEARQTEVASKFMLGSPEAFIDGRQVAVYHFPPTGKVRSILKRQKRVIDWSTFSAVSDRVANLYGDLLAETRGG